jgi:hypothetical protein
MSAKIPNFIDVVRTYRKERDLGFEEAKRQAKLEFEKRGWPMPKYMEFAK